MGLLRDLGCLALLVLAGVALFIGALALLNTAWQAAGL